MWCLFICRLTSSKFQVLLIENKWTYTTSNINIDKFKYIYILKLHDKDPMFMRKFNINKEDYSYMNVSVKIITLLDLNDSDSYQCLYLDHWHDNGMIEDGTHWLIYHLDRVGLKAIIWQNPAVRINL